MQKTVAANDDEDDDAVDDDVDDDVDVDDVDDDADADDDKGGEEEGMLAEKSNNPNLKGGEKQRETNDVKNL